MISVRHLKSVFHAHTESNRNRTLAVRRQRVTAARHGIRRQTAKAPAMLTASLQPAQLMTKRASQSSTKKCSDAADSAIVWPSAATVTPDYACPVELHSRLSCLSRTKSPVEQSQCVIRFLVSNVFASQLASLSRRKENALNRR